MTVKEYYHNYFRQDLSSFIGDTPVPYFGHSWEYDCKGLEKIDNEKRHLFLICLYFTVLIDQAIYSYYRNYYTKFESLTRYPKFCHGLGQFQKNPRALLYVPVDKGLIDKSSLVSSLKDGMELFVDEVISFLNEHMPEINAKELFDKLIYDPDVQIPEIFGLLDEKVKQNIDYIAYKTLVEIVNTRFKE